MYFLRHYPPGIGNRRASDWRERSFHYTVAVRFAVSLRNVAAAEGARVIVREQSKFDVFKPGPYDEGHHDAPGRGAGPSGIQLHDPHLADRRRNQRSLSLAHGDYPQADEGGGIRMGHRFLYQS